jgi:hypothetical protein
MGSFYKPVTTTISKIPIIIYTCQGVESHLSRIDHSSIDKHLSHLHRLHPKLITGQYHIVILWSHHQHLMSDIWIFGDLESWGSGPLVDVKIFSNYSPDFSSGVSAGDGLVLLGAEELHRRKCTSFNEYVQTRPTLPTPIRPHDSFFIVKSSRETPIH